ncbi:MAG TPA: hypothetical protein VMF57_04585 [Solirubrobacteraceae bacterium]|nr:hypothetical protein [Solirubrobacteraceae bacterium]
MSSRSRIARFGSAGLLIVAGIACAFVFSGGLGQNLAFALVALGLVAGTAFVFYEVGLTEDRARAREERARVDAALERDRGRPGPPEHNDRGRRGSPPRIERARGHLRRLR